MEPNYNSDGADSATIAQEQETQLDSRLNIGLSLYYSIYKEEEIDATQNKTLGDQIKERGNGYMNYHKDAKYEGEPKSENYDDMAYRYVDCRKCEFNLDTSKVDDYYMMKKCLDRGLNEIYQLCLNYEDNLHSYDLSINIGGYDLIEDLVGITKYILTGIEPLNGISDNHLKRHAYRNFSDKFQQLKNNGWNFKVIYTCVYSAYENFGDGEEAKKQQALKEERDHLMFVAITTEKGAAGAKANKAMRESKGSISMQSASTACHLLLGVGSLCFFWPPFAFACLAIDLSLHAVECAGAFMENDKQAAIDHCKGAMLDIVFIIPYDRIGRFMKRSALKAEEKIAAHNVKVAEKGREKSASMLDQVGKNEEEISRWSHAVEEKRIDVANKKATCINAEGETWYKQKGSTKLERKPSDSPEMERYRQAQADLEKAEADLAQTEKTYSEVAARNQRENSQLLAKTDKYKADKYNVEAKQKTSEEVQTKYTNYVNYSIEVEAKNTVKLETLLEDLKKEWNETRFISLRRAYKTTGYITTVKGISDNIETLTKYDDRIVVSSDDFTFSEIVKEAATSIGEDIVETLAKPAVYNKDFKERGGYLGTHGMM